LRQHQFDATVFLPTSFIGDTATRFKGISCLTWSQVRDLHAEGVLFGSHTVTHPQLASVGPKELEHELQHSKATIEDRLGCSVDSFAYPYAFPETDRSFKKRIKGVLDNSRYRCGVSTVIGTAAKQHERFFLPRLPMNSWDDSRLFRAKIESGYDWLHFPQYWGKVIKRRPGLPANLSFM
jgi:peptidoglycan/xylan/chitin deacetylase (PgdA/CDA1 family)